MVGSTADGCHLAASTNCFVNPNDIVCSIDLAAVRILIKIIHLLSALGDIIPVERITGAEWHINTIEFPF